MPAHSVVPSLPGGTGESALSGTFDGIRLRGESDWNVPDARDAVRLYVAGGESLPQTKLASAHDGVYGESAGGGVSRAIQTDRRRFAQLAGGDRWREFSLGGFGRRGNFGCAQRAGFRMVLQAQFGQGAFRTARTGSAKAVNGGARLGASTTARCARRRLSGPGRAVFRIGGLL